MNSQIKFLAYYLPQYHPIPENDLWWGKGFTEWTNVTKAQPLFRGHYQPRFPADLGYYDLRVPEVREHQANIAAKYGIDGFCYYHYWFGDGKKVLERPLQEVIQSKQPNFPFCICWANESWKGIWFGGNEKEMLLDQTYPGEQDYINHFNYLLPAFKDERYIKIDNKCVFNVYMPNAIPDLALFVKTFQKCANAAGIGDLYLLATRCPEDWNPHSFGFDGVVGSEFSTLRYVTGPDLQNKNFFKKVIKKIRRRFLLGQKLNLNFEQRLEPLIVDYKEATKKLLPDRKYDFDYFPCAINDWDNTARAGVKSLIFKDSTPELWESHLEQACEYVAGNTPQKQIVFIKSWNEWAEGNYLEPDKKWGFGYLEVVKKLKNKFND